MANCLLCNTKEADKKGSHIIPHFLLESLLNYDKCKGRDKEITLSINDLESSIYYGRSVTPDKIEELKGSPLNDAELEANKDPFIRDYILCSECEKKLSVLETQYAVKHNKGVEISPNISFLFWLSVLWRMSIVGDYNFGLPADLNEEIRNTLYDNMSLNKEMVNNAKIENKKWGYSLFRFSLDDIESCIFGYPYPVQPYLFVINEYIICFFPDINNANFPAFPIYSDLKELIKESNLSTLNSPEICVKIESEFKRAFLDKANHYLVEKQMLFLWAKIESVLKEFSVEPTFDLIMSIITEFTGENPDSRFMIQYYNSDRPKEILLKRIGLT